MKRVLGYCAPWSVRTGDRLEIKVSLLEGDGYKADVVRVICGCDLPGGPPEDIRLMDATINGEHTGDRQETRIGSAVLVDLPAPILAHGLRLRMWPTLLGTDQALIAGDGIRLMLLADGRVALERDGVQLVSSMRLAERQWVEIEARFADDGWSLALQPLKRGRVEGELNLTVTQQAGDPVRLSGQLAIAATPELTQCYNGKIEAPTLLDATGAALAAWDFSRDHESTLVHDAGPQGLHGRTINLPARAVMGSLWDGDVHDWRFKPAHYAAIHFHQDDLYDAGWATSLALDIPADWPSGYYAVRLIVGDDVSWCPFFVTPPPGKPTAKLAVIASTATSIAYANLSFHMRVEQEEPFLGRIPMLSREDVFLRQTPWLGLSHYDTHADGSGVRFSSRLRPVVNMGPFSDAWNLNADTMLYTWLESLGQPFDIITDEDIHAHGVALLSSYTAIIAGSHPEYYTTAMMDGMEAYLDQGGRLMYLGGNGFYWRAAFSDAFPGALELRRAESGARYWAESPGEAHMAFTGELGGLWRRCGRPPQALVGIGLRAIGFDGLGYFDMQPGANDPRAAFLVAGLEGVSRFGETGPLGSAAAEEMDAIDPNLGTPRHALVIAASGGHSQWMQLTPEDTLMPHLGLSGAYNPEVRADIVFFETASGGAVFSTGSMTWTACLSSDVAVARMTQNALERFLDPYPFPKPEGRS